MNEETKKSPKQGSGVKAKSSKPASTAKTKKVLVSVYAPVSGILKSITKISDKTFSSKTLGDGFYIEPTDGKFSSPIDGELIVAFPTKHAYGIRHESGLEVLVHIGLDTVKLDGKYFESKVKAHEKLTKSSILVNVDLTNASNDYKMDTPVVFTSENAKNAKIAFVAKMDSKVKAGDLIAKVEIVSDEESVKATSNAAIVDSADRYTKWAREIIANVGGVNNVKNCYNCVTRMRFDLADPKLVNREAIKAIKGVKGDNWAAGEYQVIIGAEVSRVTDAANANVLTGPKSSSTVTAISGTLKPSGFKLFMAACMGIFGPLIPFFIGAGLLMAGQQLLVTFDLIVDPDFSTGETLTLMLTPYDPTMYQALADQISTMLVGDLSISPQIFGWLNATYPTGTPSEMLTTIPIMPNAAELPLIDRVLNFMADTPFKVMGPIMLWSTVRYFKGNQAVAIGIGLLLISPIIPSGLTLIERGEADATWNPWLYISPENMPFFDATPDEVGFVLEPNTEFFTNPDPDIMIEPFYGTVLVFIATGLIYVFLSRAMSRKFNASADQLLNPLISIFICALAAFTLVGPLTQYMESLISTIMDWVVGLPFGLGGAIIGGTYQIFVIFGIHSLVVIGAMLPLLVGQPSIIVAIMIYAGVFGQVGAAIGVALKSKDKSVKSAAWGASVPGLVAGITEPIIYGITLPRFQPLLGGLLGAAVGGWLFAITGISWDVPAGMGGIIGIVGFTDDMLGAILITMVSTGSAILFTMLLWKEKPSEAKNVAKVTKKVSIFEVKNSPAYIKYNKELLASGISEDERKNKLNAYIAQQSLIAQPYIDKLNAMASGLKTLEKESNNFMNTELKVVNSKFMLESTQDKEEMERAALFDKANQFASKKDHEKTSDKYKAMMAKYESFNLTDKINKYKEELEIQIKNAKGVETQYLKLIDEKQAEIDKVLVDFAKAMDRKEILELKGIYYNALNAVAISLKTRQAKPVNFPSYYTKTSFQKATTAKLAKNKI